MKVLTYPFFFLIGYGLLVLISQLVVNSQMFFPPHTYQNLPGLLTLKTDDGKKIAAVYLPNPDAKYTLLYSHGNAEDLGTSYAHLLALRAQGFSVFSYDYHGYGLSEGRPTEKNLYRDINAAYHYLTEDLKIPSEKIIVYGNSIGSGPSVDLAARKPIGGLILQSPFTSIFRVLTHYPVLPFDRFSNISKVEKIDVPVLLFHGNRDRIIPFSHGKKLSEAFKRPIKTVFIEGAGHNDLIMVGGDKYWGAIREFVKEF